MPVNTLCDTHPKGDASENGVWGLDIYSSFFGSLQLGSWKHGQKCKAAISYCLNRWFAWWHHLTNHHNPSLFLFLMLIRAIVDPYKNDVSAFWKYILRRPCFYGVWLKMFSLPRDKNSKTRNYLLSYFLAHHKSSHHGLFQAEHAKR